MIRLSAFADEISPDLDEQIAVLQGEGIHHLDLRAVWSTNVLDLTDAQVAEIERALAGNGMAVAAIGSPIGKVPIDALFEEELRRLERAMALAGRFGTPFVRIFSFYPPASDPDARPEEYRVEVLARLREMTARAAAADIVLLHENDTDLYGDTISRCLDLLQSIDDEHFRAALDPANFIQSGQRPYPAAYDAMWPWLGYVHVKDARSDGSVAPAGQGEARWPDVLRRLREDGYEGTFALEPHLAAAGQFQGFSGPELFRQASRAFQELLRAASWSHA